MITPRPRKLVLSSSVPRDITVAPCALTSSIAIHHGSQKDRDQGHQGRPEPLRVSQLPQTHCDQPLTRHRTFLKRKGGLFKKAHELSVLCSVDVAVIIFGHNKKLYEFSSGDINETIGRYQYVCIPTDPG